jgi:hypothetical protein
MSIGKRSRTMAEPADALRESPSPRSAVVIAMTISIRLPFRKLSPSTLAPQLDGLQTRGRAGAQRSDPWLVQGAKSKAHRSAKSCIDEGIQLLIEN